MAGNAVRPLDAASARSLFPAGPLPRPCESDVRRGTALRLYVYDIGEAYNRQIVDYVETRARDLLGDPHRTLPRARLTSSPCARDAPVGVRCAYLREDTCPNEGFSHLENLRSHCTDVPLMAKLIQATTIVTNPENADIFLVPFLLGCNAMLGWCAPPPRAAPAVLPRCATRHRHITHASPQGPRHDARKRSCAPRLLRQVCLVGDAPPGALFARGAPPPLPLPSRLNVHAEVRDPITTTDPRQAKAAAAAHDRPRVHVATRGPASTWQQ